MLGPKQVIQMRHSTKKNNVVQHSTPEVIASGIWKIHNEGICYVSIYLLLLVLYGPMEARRQLDAKLFQLASRAGLTTTFINFSQTKARRELYDFG